MLSSSKKNGYQTALSILSRRDHSQAELKQKLAQRGFSSDEIQKIIERCLRWNYLDDQRFADNYTRLCVRNGFGSRRIYQKLRDKKVPVIWVDAAIETHCTDDAQYAQCLQMLQKKSRTIKIGTDIASMRLKLYRYLLGRGFPPAIIHKALERAEKKRDRRGNAG